MRYHEVPGRRGRCPAPDRVAHVAVRVAGQVPAGALAVQAAVVQRAAGRVGDVLAALVALDLPGDRRARRVAERGGDQAAALLVRVVDAAVLVVRRRCAPSPTARASPSPCRPLRHGERRRCPWSAARRRRSAGRAGPGSRRRARPAAGRLRRRRSRRLTVAGAGAGEPAAVPDVAVVEAVVVGGQHRLPGRRLGGAVRAWSGRRCARRSRRSRASPPGDPAAYRQVAADRSGSVTGAGPGQRPPGDRLPVPLGRAGDGRAVPGDRAHAAAAPRPPGRCRPRSVSPVRSRVLPCATAVRTSSGPRTSTGPAVVSCRQNVPRGRLVGEQQGQRRSPAAGDPHPGQPGVGVVEPQVAGGGVVGAGHRAGEHLRRVGSEAYRSTVSPSSPSRP